MMNSGLTIKNIQKQNIQASSMLYWTCLMRQFELQIN